MLECGVRTSVSSVCVGVVGTGTVVARWEAAIRSSAVGRYPSRWSRGAAPSDSGLLWLLMLLLLLPCIPSGAVVCHGGGRHKEYSPDTDYRSQG